MRFRLVHNPARAENLRRSRELSGAADPEHYSPEFLNLYISDASKAADLTPSKYIYATVADLTPAKCIYATTALRTILMTILFDKEPLQIEYPSSADGSGPFGANLTSVLELVLLIGKAHVKRKTAILLNRDAGIDEERRDQLTEHLRLWEISVGHITAMVDCIKLMEGRRIPKELLCYQLELLRTLAAFDQDIRTKLTLTPAPKTTTESPRKRKRTEAVSEPPRQRRRTTAASAPRVAESRTNTGPNYPQAILDAAAADAAAHASTGGQGRAPPHGFVNGNSSASGSGPTRTARRGASATTAPATRRSTRNRTPKASRL